MILPQVDEEAQVSGFIEFYDVKMNFRRLEITKHPTCDTQILVLSDGKGNLKAIASLGHYVCKDIMAVDLERLPEDVLFELGDIIYKAGLNYITASHNP